MNPGARESLRAALGAPGFDEVRFASAASPVAGDFAAWLDAGHHADMAWLERGREKRLEPQRVLPGARSFVVLGVNYFPADRRGATQQRWAKYALYSDYHDTILRGLRAAGAELEARGGITRDDYRVYVDTGPLLERGWAAAAGAGFQGKNGMLISRRHGNWLFLAVIVTRLDIPPDEPLRGVTQLAAKDERAPAVGLHCGTCTRCLDACPTNAFAKPGWVDARRCISYHTIENRGVIPRELRAGFGGRVFGCDVCLDVCPWNRFARAGRSALLAARTELVDVSLLDLLALDERRFAELFRKLPMKRTKLAGMLRNACIVAGNWAAASEWHFGGAENRESVAAAVERLCRHESGIVRAHAVWALFRLLDRDEAAARLRETRASERSEIVLAEYAAAFADAL